MKRILVVAVAALSLLALPALAGSGCGADKAYAKQASAQKNFDSKVKNLDNGVEVMLTSADAKVVKAMQKEAKSFLAGACAKSCPMKAEGSTHKVKNLDNGVMIRATAGCPTKVKEIQAYAAEKIATGEFFQKAMADTAANAG